MNKQLGYAIATLILVVMMVLVALYLPIGGMNWWLWAWIITMALMFLVIGIIGLSAGAEGGFWAIFIDDRKMVSLSRFQVVLWTVLILSAFMTIALGRLGDSWRNPAGYDCPPQAAASAVASAPTPAASEPTCAAPADLQLPPILWALMGISVTSSIASPLIKDNNQRNKQSMYTKAGTKQNPQFADMFHGETQKNYEYVDMAKVQNFFFTVVSVVTYAVALGFGFIGAQNIASFFIFPAISQGLVTILGISHAGYLTSKVVTSDPPAPAG
jgi:hypothetical protein